MAVTSVHIYYPSNVDPVTGALTAQTKTAYDLRKVSTWTDGSIVGSGALATVLVTYDTLSPTRLHWPKTEFEAAITASLA